MVSWLSSIYFTHSIKRRQHQRTGVRYKCTGHKDKIDLQRAPGKGLTYVLGLLRLNYVLVKVLLQTETKTVRRAKQALAFRTLPFVGVVDTKLLERIVEIRGLEAEHVQNANPLETRADLKGVQRLQKDIQADDPSTVPASTAPY